MPARTVPAGPGRSLPRMTTSTPEALAGSASASAPTPEELLARFGLEAFRPGQREAVAGRAGRPRQPRGDADGRRQVALLPAAGAGRPRPGGRREPADRADVRPAAAARAGGRERDDAGVGDGGGPQRAGARDRSPPATRSSCWPRPSGSPRPPSARRWRAGRCRCSWSTRRTAWPSGATTSGPDYLRLAGARSRRSGARR